MLVARMELEIGFMGAGGWVGGFEGAKVQRLVFGGQI